MFVRVFEEDLLIRKIQLRKDTSYRVGSDSRCEIKLSGALPLEGEIVWKDGYWFYKKVKEKDGLELSPGTEIVVGDYKLRFAEPVFGSATEDRTVVYQMNDATIVIDRGAKPKLVFLEGEFKGKEVFIDKPIFTVGRVAGNDLVVPHPSVSKRHCRIVKKGKSYIVEDFSSTNGTFVNSHKVKNSMELKSGDILEVGLAKLQFWLGENIYSSGSPSEKEVTIVKGKKLNLRVVVLVILILLFGSLALFIPSEKREKVQSPSQSAPLVVLSPKKGTTFNQAGPMDKSSSVPSLADESSQDKKIEKKKAEQLPREKKPEIKKKGISSTSSKKITLKRKFTHMRKNSTSLKIVPWWRNVPCSVIWQNAGSAKMTFSRAPDLRKKVYICGEVKIKSLLAKQDFQGALKVYNTVKNISGKIPNNLLELFDNAVKKIYRQGYLLEDVDPEAAKEIYKRVIRITPPESEYHKKALSRLE